MASDSTEAAAILLLVIGALFAVNMVVLSFGANATNQTPPSSGFQVNITTSSVSTTTAPTITSTATLSTSITSTTSLSTSTTIPSNTPANAPSTTVPSTTIPTNTIVNTTTTIMPSNIPSNAPSTTVPQNTIVNTTTTVMPSNIPSNAPSSTTIPSNTQSNTIISTTLLSTSTSVIPNAGTGIATVTGPFPSNLVQTTTCYLISNFSASNSENFMLNGASFNVIEVSIGAATARVTVNGTGYTLAIGGIRALPSTANYLYFTVLDNVSYVPVGHKVNLTGAYSLEHVINLTVCSSPIVNSTNSTNIALPVNSSTTIPFDLGRYKRSSLNQNALQSGGQLDNIDGYNFTNIFSTYGINAIANITSFNESNLNYSQLSIIRGAFKAVGRNISTVRVALPYGSVRFRGSYLAHGQGGYYLEQGSNGTAIYNITVTKAVPRLSVNINGYNISAPNTTIIHLPVINGSLGLTGGKTYQVNGSLSTSLLNNVSLSYSVKVGNSLVENSTVNTSSVYQPLSINVPLDENATITFDAKGNANYTPVDPTVIVLPTNIVAYVPITFTNTQSSAIAANTPLAVGVTTGNTIIGFNALKYQQYETCNLNNGEFFFPNGTIITSWIEGNIVSEITANDICTGPTSANSLSSSANVLYWLKYNWPSTFLPATTGTNTVYLGWAGNILSAANILLGGPTGEAPQLSCSTPTNPVKCTSSTVNGILTGNYAEWDNGNAVFSFYDNFTSSTLKTKWNAAKGGTPPTVTVYNGISLGTTMTGNGGIISLSNTATTTNQYWFEGLIGQTTTPSQLKYAGFEESTGNAFTTGTNELYSSGYFVADNNIANVLSLSSNAIGHSNVIVTVTHTAAQPSVIGVAWPATGTENFAYDYNTNTLTANSLNTLGNIYYSIEVMEIASATYTANVQWVRSRIYPPSGVLPSTSVGNNGCVASITPPSNAIVDVNQYESFTGSNTNCVSTYTYNIMVVNSVTLAPWVHNDLVSGLSTTPLVYTFQITSALDTPNTPERANMIFTDSGTNQIVTPYTTNFVVNPALSAVVGINSIPSLPSNLAPGTPITFTATWSGGSSGYTLNYIISNSVTNTPLTSQLVTVPSGTSNSFTWAIPLADTGNTIQANVLVTDSATTNAIANSVYTGAITIVPPTTPPYVLYYTPIVLANYQPEAVAANTPLPIGANGLGKITGFNALAYNQYETCDLNNAEFFFGNGTVATSWLEGNTLSEITANGICTGTTSSNSLIISTNILYWIKDPSVNFLPANTGVPTWNVIYLGWAGNILSTTNVLLGGSTGEAPQLSCSTPTNPAACSSSTVNSITVGTYAEYDNGNAMFSFYDNFTAATLSSKWLSTVGGTPPTVTVYNGVSLKTTTTGNGGIISAANYPTSTNQYWFEGMVTQTTTTSALKFAGFEESTGNTFTTGANDLYNKGYFVADNDLANVLTLSSNAVGNANIISTVTTTGALPSILGVVWNATGEQNFAYDYNTNSLATNSLNTLSNLYYSIEVMGLGGSVTYTANVQWVRARIYPPNGVVASSIPGNAIIQPSPSLTFNSLTVSNYILDVGENTILTAYVYNGVSAYTYNFVLVNSITKSTVVNNALYYPVIARSNAVTITATAADASNSPLYANVMITDSNVPAITVNSVYSASITVNSLPTLTLTPSNTILDTGQTEVYTLSESGGTGTSNAVLYNITGSHTQGSNVIIPLHGSNTVSFVVGSSTPANNIQYNAIAYDQGTSIPYVFNSIPNTIVVSPALSAAVGINAIPSSPQTLAPGTPITFAATWSGGSTGYTVNYIISNSVTNTPLTSQQFSVGAATSNSFTWIVPVAEMGNTIHANAVVTDSATTNEIANSVYTGTVTLVQPSSPPGVLYYLPIVLVNYQNSAVAANTPLPIGATSTGRIIGFNALAFQQYETCDLGNAQFFFQNGTVINSWMEGNLISEVTANALCTSSASANSLVDSANVLYWLKYNWPSTFLPANTGLATSNVVYIGWAGNAISTFNTLLSNTLTGEAPQLSCSIPASPNPACAPTTVNGVATGAYAQYDNGNSVFSLYDNFTTILPTSGAWASSGSGGALSQAANGLEARASTVLPVYFASASSYSGYPYWFEGLVLPATTSSTTSELGLEESTSPTHGTSAFDSGFFIGTNTAANVIPVISSSTGILTFNAVVTSSGTRPAVIGVGWAATGTINNHYDYNTNSITGNSLAIGSQYFGIIIPITTSSTYTGYLQWVRARIYPPNGVPPGSINGTTQNTCSALITAPTNALVDVNQYESFTATETGCTSSTWTYNMLVVNAVTPNTIPHNDLVSGSSAASLTYTFQITSALDTANTPEKANTIMSETSGTTGASSYSANFVVSQAQVAGVLTESNTIIDNSQSSTLTASSTGGTPSISYNWFSQASCGGTSIGSGTTISVSPSSTTTYSFNAVDSASTQNVICSASNTVTVYTTPTLTSLTPSSASVNSGQTVVYNVVLSGGLGPFTVNLVNTAGSGTVVNTITWTTLTPISNIITFAANTPAPTSQTFNVIATDTGTVTTPFVFNSISNTVLVNSACYISLSNTLVGFGSINPGLNVPTANAVTVTDNFGSAAANILIAGGIGNYISPGNNIWVGSSAGNTIGIANTLWNPSLLGTYSGNALSNTPMDTDIVLPNPGGGSTSNTLYLGMGIPSGTVVDTYTTNVVVEVTC
jgi:hypothetical protein